MVILTHKQAQSLIQKAADDCLTSRQQTSLDAHLAKCIDCRAYSEKLFQLQADLQDIWKDRWKRNRPRYFHRVYQETFERDCHEK